LVHPPFQRKEFPVFSLNERVILDLETPLGRCVLVMVAGWGVGNITHPFPTRLRPRRGRITREQLAEPRAGAVTHVERDEPVLYGRPALSIPTLVASATVDER
jgi:phosphatidylserine decarboxylase